MLIRIVATNFKSYKEETEFNMLPSSSVRRKDWHIHKADNGIGSLRTAVIYGANGAGKSCLIKAFGRLQNMVVRGCLPPSASRVTNKYNSPELPVSLEIEFSTHTGQYSYGVSYNGNICVEEWLYSTAGSPIRIFERTYDSTASKSHIELAAEKEDEAKNKLLTTLLEDNLLKENEILLSKHDVIKNTQITDAYMWIVSKLHIITPETHSTSIFDDRYSNLTFKSQSEQLMDALDLGISELTLIDEDIESFKQSISGWPKLAKDIVDQTVKRLSKLPNGEQTAIETGTFTVNIRKENNNYFVRRVMSGHKVNGRRYDFELKEESDGTQRIFDFVPMLQEVKSKDETYVIDEIDRSLHPSLVRALVTLILSDANMKGQLIFTTHDAGLLDGKLFRNDEIWFAEKDRESQSTHLYTLDEFKPRADLNIEKGYLNGRFGAIPFLAKLDELNWE